MTHKPEEYVKAILEYLKSEFPDAVVSHSYNFELDAEQFQVFFGRGEARFRVRREELSWFEPDRLVEELQCTTVADVIRTVAPKVVGYGRGGVYVEG